MQVHAFPAFHIQASIRAINGKKHIYDSVRRKYVRLTPEEWTRQHFLHYLTEHLTYPKSLIRVEKIMPGHYKQDRPDIVVYANDGHPWLVAECKASTIPLTMEVYTQLTRYNRKLQAPLWVITNGIQYGCWQMKEGEVQALDTIPPWEIKC